ncbi:MAG: Asp-tRNA(Asn)/Glu-tRNA(Gln) amidotransferase subunit GatC [Pseudomonadaceae bacterium]|nr:Asp-tRNA(Asn)/Glu-tRNA(Gln) amidotransferase subunit GatC [Pseudomonadaceae bacterium]
MSDSIDIAHLSKLAQLALEPTEAEHAQADLMRIIDMVDAMQAVDTNAVAPLSNPLDASARLRPDVVTEDDNREANQASAPLTADGLYLVPRVVE